jgi:hypothetical protein
MRFTLMILLCTSQLTIADEPSPAKAYQSMVTEYENEGGARLFAKRFLAFSKEHLDDPVSADALLWIVDNVPGRVETDQAVDLLQRHHVTSTKMGSGCKAIARSRAYGAEKLLRATLVKNKDKGVQAHAAFYLAALLDREADIAGQLQAEPELAPRVLQYYGKEYGDHLSSLNLTELASQRQKAYEQILASFPNVEIADQRIGRVAEDALFAIRHLSVGRVAPEIQGAGINAKELKLSDHRGKVVMIYFWGHW